MLLGSKKESIENLCKDFGIDILYVFGSRFKEVVDFLSKDESASWCRVYSIDRSLQT
jgi:hypothetical protein